MEKMKCFTKSVLGILMLIGLMFFVAGCSDDPKGGGGDVYKSQFINYSGKTSEGEEYTLKITEVKTSISAHSTRSAEYTPKSGDLYELSIKGGKTSKGIVEEVNGETLILKPDNSDDIFVAEVSQTAGLISLEGTITWIDGSSKDVSKKLSGGDTDTGEEKAGAAQLIANGNAALKNKNYDQAVSFYEAAYNADNNDAKAIIYSTLAKIAKISTDQKVIDLFKKRLGFKDYPNKLNALFSTDWMTNYPDEEIVWGYYDNTINKWVYWRDKWDINYYGLDKVGYYYDDGHYILVSETPKYETSNYSLPELLIPSWIKGGSDSWYNQSLTSGGVPSFETWALLLFANAVDKNPNGLNNALDEMISAVFGNSFNDALARIKRLENRKNDRITLDRDFIEALDLDEFTPITEYDYIGWAEINAITSMMVGIKAACEWVAAYDWNINLNVFKTAWKEGEEFWYGRIEAMNKNDLPFNNNFLNARPGKMAVAKQSFITAIQGIQASYESILTSNLYPTEVKDAYPTLNDGITKLLAAIRNGGKFWIPEDPTRGTWPASGGRDVILGVDMGKFFQEGYFSLKNIFETDGGKPAFYLDGEKLTLANYERMIQTAENNGDYISLGFKTKVINDIIFDFPELDREIPELKRESVLKLETFPPELAKILFEKYYK